MTREELVANLAPVRVPESFARFDAQDALAACALGLIAGLLLSGLLRLVTVRRTRPVDRARAAMAELSTKTTQARITGLAALLRAHGGAGPDGLHAALYDPRATVDPAELEAAVLDAARRGPAR